MSTTMQKLPLPVLVSV